MKARSPLSWSVIEWIRLRATLLSAALVVDVRRCSSATDHTDPATSAVQTPRSRRTRMRVDTQAASADVRGAVTPGQAIGPRPSGERRIPRKGQTSPGMRAVVQRVAWARVVVDGDVVGEIGPGLCVL